MGLRFDPVGGGQFKVAVQQMIEAENKPIKQLEARKAKEDTRLKLFQEFKSKFGGLDKAISELTTFRKFRELKADLGDGANLASVTLDKERAEPGTYVIEIDELATRTSAISNGFENPDDPILGMGFVTMNLSNGDSVDIYVEDGQSSLRGVASTINKKADSPVRASVIKDSSDPDTPWKLLLTGKKDGQANQINFPEFYFMESDEEFFIDEDKEAQNAQLLIDGFPIESETNQIRDFLPGVNLTLKQARPDQPFTLTITEDYQKMGGKMKNLVDQLNQVLQFIVKQNTIDEHTDTSTTFAGDTSLQTMEYRMRNLLHEGFFVGEPDSGEVLHLNQLGVEFEKNGSLSFKEDKFEKSVEGNFDKVAQAVTGPMGIANQLRVLLDGYTRSSNGFLNIKEKAIRDRIKDIDNQIDDKTRYVEKRKQAITDQFARLEGTLGNLQRQQQYLSATLGGGGGGNMVSQLLGG